MLLFPVFLVYIENWLHQNDSVWLLGSMLMHCHVTVPASIEFVLLSIRRFKFPSMSTWVSFRFSWFPYNFQAHEGRFVTLNSHYVCVPDALLWTGVPFRMCAQLTFSALMLVSQSIASLIKKKFKLR